MLSVNNTEDLIVTAEPAYKTIKVAIAAKSGTTVNPLCLCIKPMCRKGTLKLVCKEEKCPLTIDYQAFVFFVKNNYFIFHPSHSDTNIHHAVVDVPLCVRCSGKGGDINLLSYLSPKTKDYPAHQGIVWRCACKQNYRAGLQGELCGGWNKFGPNIDLAVPSTSASFSVESSNRTPFDYSSYFPAD